jgi:hypothetical protein
MNKVLLGLLLGAVLGAIDGLVHSRGAPGNGYHHYRFHV